MSGTVRVDWQAIKAKWGPEVGELHLALLPKGAVQLLLAISDRLQWEATYRIEAYDFADWDELQAIVDLGLGGLTDTVRLADLLNSIDEIEGLLAQLVAKDVCCPGPIVYDAPLDQAVDDIIGDNEDTTGSEIERGTGTPPLPATNWDEWNQLFCDAVAFYVDGLPKVIQRAEILQGVLSGATITVLAGLMWGILPLLGIVTTTVGVLVSALSLLERLGEIRGLLTGDNPWEDIALEIQNAREDLICSIYSADTPLAAESAFRSQLAAASETGYPWIRLLTNISHNIRHLYALNSTAPQGYGGTECVACEEPTFDQGYLWQELNGNYYPPSIQGSEGCFNALLNGPRYVASVQWYLDNERTTKLSGGAIIISDSAEGQGGGGAPIYRASNEQGLVVVNTNDLATFNAQASMRNDIHHIFVFHDQIVPNFELCVRYYSTD